MIYVSVVIVVVVVRSSSQAIISNHNNMLKRRVIVVRVPQSEVRNNSTAIKFDCVAYFHTVTSHVAIPDDRWYALRDVNPILESLGLAKIDESEAKPWEFLVRKYNTTLNGLSYSERSVKVLPSTKFASAITLKELTGCEFE